MNAPILPASVTRFLNSAEGRGGIGIVVARGNVRPKTLTLAENLATTLGLTVMVTEQETHSSTYKVIRPSIIFLPNQPK